MTQRRPSIGLEVNSWNRPETVIDWDYAQGPFPDRKAVIRANCCGAERSLRKLRRLWDLEAEEAGLCG